MSKYLALVPLRGGSKSIPDKNIRLIAGKPLCFWVLNAACHSGVFSKVVVSTDSLKIAKIVDEFQLPVEIIDRPEEFATDTASTESVMLHAASILDFDVLATIQATSPLVTADDFKEACALFDREGFDSMLTAVRIKRFFWNDKGETLNYDPSSRPRRQDFSGSLMENGAFYLTKREVLESAQCRLGGKVGIYEMAENTAVEIDEPEDWEIVEKQLLDRQSESLMKRLQKIKLLVVDVDGTLTDAGMYWSAEGDQLKKFNTRDAKGLELVRNSGVDVAIMTTENSPIVTARAKKLGINHCYIGIENKLSCLMGFTNKLGVSLDEVAYIGDDVNDLDCLKKVGFSACPADGVEIVKETVHHITEQPGGAGAVRSICDLICSAKEPSA